MKMQTLQGRLPRSVLLSILIGMGAGVVAQEPPPVPEVPTPSTPGMPPAEDVDELTDDLQAQTPDAGDEADTETAQADPDAPPLPGAEQAVTRSDGEILQALKVLSETEVNQAELAIEEASSQEVKDTAQRIIAEHSNTIQQIDAVLTRTGVSLTESPLSAELLERSEATTDDLAALSGTEFECTYLQRKADDHQFALETLDHELLPFAKSFSVRNFLSEAAPKLEQQAVAAREMHANLDSCG